jgi:hypothetical protein
VRRCVWHIHIPPLLWWLLHVLLNGWFRLQNISCVPGRDICQRHKPLLLPLLLKLLPLRVMLRLLLLLGLCMLLLPLLQQLNFILIPG